jgi:hypothetical protein
MARASDSGLPTTSGTTTAPTVVDALVVAVGGAWAGTVGPDGVPLQALMAATAASTTVGRRMHRIMQGRFGLSPRSSAASVSSAGYQSHADSDSASAGLPAREDRTPKGQRGPQRRLGQIRQLERRGIIGDPPGRPVKVR